MSSLLSEVASGSVFAAQQDRSPQLETLHDDTVQQVAMMISEEIARLSRAHAPVPLDLPLAQAGLSQSALASLHSWLQTFYDFKGDIQLLLANDLSAETLAQLIANGTAGSDGGKRKRRLRPKHTLSVDIKKGNELGHPEVIPTQSPSPVQITRPSKSASNAGRVIVPEEIEELDIGMASYESWCGKKTGMVAGLLALAMLGSPTSHLVGGDIARPNLSINPHAPLLDVLSPLPGSRSLLSPWLDVVHFEGLEPIQSPWVADSSSFFDLNVPQSVSPY